MGTHGRLSGSLIVGPRRHEEGVRRLLASFEAVPRGEPVRLAKKTSNLFRPRASSSSPGLDTTGLTRVVSVDPDARTADVQGMCTYEDLVDATLPYGLMPFVVPQLKTITLGGAVTGLGIESSSFRLGLPHESVLEMDVLTGTGEIVTARPDGTDRERELYRGFPNSYGSLGYAVRLRIALEPVERYVGLRHVRFDSLAALTDGLARIGESGSYDDEEVDFLDGVVFSAGESYLTLGRRTDEPGPVSDYTGVRDKQAIYYRSIQHGGPAGSVARDRLTIRDYLWRWDTDWFWCSRAFGVQNPGIRRWWPQQLLRSSAYWKIIGLDHRYDLGNRIGALKGEGPRERVVQDVEVTIDRTEEFLEWFLREVPIEPLWICPLRLRESTPAPGVGGGPGSDRPWPLYPLAPETTYVNIGFWSSAPIEPGMAEGAWNRRIEEEVSRLGGHKSLYSEVFYSREEFDQLYGGEHAAHLKTRFDPRGRFATLYDKSVGAR
ncbi:MAG: FAD-binding oxidoreductase [Dietzia sp.]|uniref:FAD-binding oxidoreductase n=1 Tax=unclassified Dietzia TaxID=2617939 RepID=UPI0015CDAF37|nr:MULTISPECIES: FAD-binding oxidoreductase [unclassified Dietzia]MBB1056656.1 FAD-binding oxidoreductase [Dietzia sp. B19]MDO8396004.1 FAD-binding oxidoreductase [Dietzia sp.]